jgi:nucleoside-triphosphatase THEP1
MVDNLSEQNLLKRNAELLDKKLIDNSQKEGLDRMIKAKDAESVFLAQELIRLKISETLLKNLNKGQSNCFAEIIDFIQNPQHDAVMLTGYAGTGKTFLIKRILEYLQTSYPAYKIAITAPTNKAVQVLHRSSAYGTSAKIFEEYGVPKDNLAYCTIHKLLNLREEIDENGNQTFVMDSKQAASLTFYKVIIVDEVSMLNDHLYKQLISQSKACRLIFIADPCQIPPVNNTDSLPLTTRCKDNLLRLELTEIMRQKGSHPIVDVSVAIRKNLTSVYPVKISTRLNDAGNGIIHICGKTNRKMTRNIIAKHLTHPSYQDSPDYFKIIAWTNVVVNSLNNICRDTLFGQNIQRFMVGDKIVANKALFNKVDLGRSIGNKWIVKSTTSEEFIVRDVTIRNITYKESIPGNFFATVQETFKFWVLTCSSYNGSVTINVIHEDDAELYKQLLTKLKNSAKSKKDKTLWALYYDVVKWNDNISYNYAITAHRSQGSTYTNTLIIEEDIDKNPRLVERNRIKYTAYTRATDKLYILK